MSRSGNWMIAAGAFVTFVSLCFLPAALGEHPDGDLRVLAACLFSVGALILAGGTYVKARMLKSAIESRDPSPGTASRRMRGGCDLCGSEAPAIHCKVHQLHLCGTCLAEHYDVRSCAYAPSTRASGAKNGRNLAARARGA